MIRNEYGRLRSALGLDAVGGAVAGVVAVQLALSVRFVAKYGPAAWAAAHLVLLAGGTALAVGGLRSARVRRLLGSPELFWSALAGLVAVLLVAYPRADGLRAVGGGSDQDDCVASLVGNVLAGRAPYSPSYLGHPCSTGPAEVLPYLPVVLSRAYFALVPALALALGYWVLAQVVDRRLARMLVLTQLTSLLFLELSATGSDFVPIGWLFAAAVVLTGRGLAERRTGVAALGVVAYVLFAGSRVPLALTAAGSLAVLCLAVRARRTVAAVALAVLATVVVYLAGYLAGPASFAPAHTFGKAVGFVRDLGTPVTVVLVLLAGGLTALALRPPARRLAGRYAAEANLVLVLFPMAAASLGELAAKGGDLARWEGLNYLLVAVPCGLLVVAQRLRAGLPTPAPETPHGHRSSPHRPFPSPDAPPDTVLACRHGSTPLSSPPTTPRRSAPA